MCSSDLFMTQGVGGLLRDKTRPSRIAPLKLDVIDHVVALTLNDAPGETTHPSVPTRVRHSTV